MAQMKPQPYPAPTVADLNKSLVGFDWLFTHQLQSAQRSNYPPHNSIKYDDNTYGIEIAVAGFEQDELSVQINQNILTVVGAKIDSEEPGIYLHRGLATRDFTQKFTLAEHMVVNGATCKNGVLHIDIRRVLPDALKPREIQIIAQ